MNPHEPPRRERQRPSLQKPWNLSALLMAFIAVALMLLAVVTVDKPSSKTGDYLELSSSNNQATIQSKKDLSRLLKRDRYNYQQSANRKASPVEPGVMKLKMGIYAMNNYGINLQVPSFNSTGYWWLKWGDDLQSYLTENNLKIWKVLAPINLLDIPEYPEWVFTPTGKDEPIRMEDGSWYMTGAYSGKFFIDRTDFSHHPFTTISLPLMIEADDIGLSITKLQIVPDMKGSGIGQFVYPNSGWVPQGWSLAAYKHHYDTDFGFGEEASVYSQLVFEVKYASSSWAAFWKVMMPLMIVVAMIVGASKLETTHYDVRLTLPVTILLTLIFLQQTHDANLPHLPYLTFQDEAYVVSYILTLGSFVIMLWTCRRYYKALEIKDPIEQEIEMKILEKSDDYWPTFVIAAGVISLTIAWFTS